MRKINNFFGLLTLASFVIASVFSSCNQIPSDVKISVINEVRNDSLDKVNVDVRLNKKVTTEVLKLVGEKLKNDLNVNQYSKIWMFYYLPDMKVGSGAWGTTHFTPELEVKILGATESQSNEMEAMANKVEGKVIGKWREEQYTASVYIIYENENGLFIRTIYPNFQVSDENIETKNDGEAIRYNYKTNSYNGEYFKVRNNELEFYNKENKMFTIGKPIK
ncbi:MAG: hypothetical protein K0B10_11035 [Vicingaceae bacterium]|nr:hypothetical protein [Vicingaceae bacterium]